MFGWLESMFRQRAGTNRNPNSTAITQFGTWSPAQQQQVSGPHLVGLGRDFRGSGEAGSLKALPDHEFHSAIAGVSYKNADGSSRQRIIEESVRPGNRLGFRLENDNPVDPNAVAVFAPNGQQIGYLRARNGLPGEVREWLAKGRDVRLTVSEVTGGIRDKPTHGVNILVQVH